MILWIEKIFMIPQCIVLKKVDQVGLVHAKGAKTRHILNNAKGAKFALPYYLVKPESGIFV